MKLTAKHLLLYFLLALLAPVVFLALFVEDWRRDLTTNVASTSAEGKDPTLRPVTVKATEDQILSSIQALCDSSRSWEFAMEQENPPANAAAFATVTGTQLAQLHLVHLSSLMKYRDDVWIVLEEAGSNQIRVHIESRSRLGKGDLGQNPRNIRKLLSYLRSQ